MDLDAFEELKRRYQVIVGIGFVFLCGIVVATFVMLSVRGSGFEQAVSKEYGNIARMIFLVISLVILLFIPAIGHLLVGKVTISGAIYQHKDFWPDYIKRLFHSALIIYVLSEIPVVFAVLLFLITHQVADYCLLVGISFVCFFFYFPRYAQWEFYLRAIH